ncbi:MAG TPA: protein kinase [Bryobacteraceae bacterium]|nr:protein kinase [Bryobacteraceae bacterium]
MSLQAGMQVGDYQILRELGAGGMGKVFQVRNVISDRIEAMKVLLPDLAGDAGLADRFLREIKVQAALEHPNIAGLRTAMRDNNQLLMVMEYVEGRTVGEYLDQGPVPLENAVALCMEVLGALDYAHSRGIVHRDIKPSNIMITPQGQVKLMDFGIARVMNDPSLTQTHQTTGSLYYMSPEQINGAQLDGRSDLYSLAISLYEMITGKRPFDGENTFAIMAAHMQQPPVPPVQHDPRVPVAVSDVIVMGMAKDANARFQTAGAFRAALGRAMQEHQQPAYAEPQPQQAPHAPQPQPAYAGAPVPEAHTRQGSGPRTIYMLAGSLATLAVAAVLFTQAPKFFKTNAQQPVTPQIEQPQTPVQPATDQPAVTPQEQPPQAQPAVPVAQQPATPTGAPHSNSPANNRPAYSAPAVSQQPIQRPSDRASEEQDRPAAPPQQQAATQTAPPAAPAVDRTAIDEQRKRVIQMAQRIVTAKAALQSLRESMASQGLRPRAELQGFAQRMQFEMDQGEAALNGNNAAGARQHLDYAERALESLEKALNL